jgi:hypothetical protein
MNISPGPLLHVRSPIFKTLAADVLVVSEVLGVAIQSMGGTAHELARMHVFKIEAFTAFPVSTVPKQYCH